jgi:hypothetical protein
MFRLLQDLFWNIIAARLICMCCGADLGPSDTDRDSHGICDDCFANWDPEKGCP